ncbi:MAG TPA: hypothetical protein VFB84_19010 [Micromonosporaceae bacterium]|nr:hypothetical protein [Micromonosporaceae bacterium]
MRHFGSVLLSLVLAPLIWLSAGVGASKLAEGLADDPDRRSAFVGLVAIGVGGLLYSLLVLSRLSPLGPVLVGLAFGGATVWAVVAANSFRDMVPEDFLGVSGAGRLPASGYAALLAVPLLATIFSARRWRRYDYEPDEASQQTGYGGASLSETRRTSSYGGDYDPYGYGSSSYGSSSYGGYDSPGYDSYGSSRHGSSYSPASPPLSTYRRGDDPDDTQTMPGR